MNIKNISIPSAELMSALVDGELDLAECKNALGLNGASSDVALQWRTYHLIGDALRAGSQPSLQADHGADVLFVNRLNQRLALEKVLPADSSPVLVEAMTLPPLQPVSMVEPAVKQAANDGNVRWKMLAGVACLGTVGTLAMLAWNVSGLNSGSAVSGQLAQSGLGAGLGQIVVISAQGPVVRDARLEEMLAAHKQMVGTSLPVPTGFLRNANFESAAGASR